MGLVKSSSGEVVYNGENILNKRTRDIVSKGIVMVPEGRRVFPNLNVEENLILGAYIRKDKEAIKKDMNFVYELFPRLKERKWQKAGTMSGGEQQMLAVGRALMTKPKLLLMDEPSLGLAPLIVKDIFQIIKEIHKDGVTILLVEQNAKAALEIADYGYVLETGTIVLEGKGKDLLNNDDVQRAYLGEAK
jgi:branched-chain amino acid transport system ATP-binding protein